MKKLKTFGSLALIAALLSGTTLLLAGCPGKLSRATSSTDNVSMTEIAEAVLSGAVTSTWSNGSQANHLIRHESSFLEAVAASMSVVPEANAAFSGGGCPTVTQGDLYFGGVECTAAATQLILTYPPCNLANPYGVWSGGETFTTTVGSLTYACGSAQPFANGVTIVRSFAAPSGRIANPQIPNVITSGFPVNVLVDTSQTCILNHAGCAGYSHPVSIMQETIVFQGAVQRTVSIDGLHLSGLKDGYVVWDFTINTPTPLQINSSNQVVAGGQIQVQNNYTNITTISTVGTALAYSVGCGVPTGGVLNTALSTNPAIVGDGANATSLYLPETMTFNASCATATLANTNSTNTSYILYHAY